MAQPKNARELLDLMLDDPRLRRRIEKIVEDSDRVIEANLLSAIQQFIEDTDTELASISHEDTARAIKSYYREIRADGHYVKLW